MSTSRDATGGEHLRAQLARVERSREQIAKAWLVEVILNSPLADAEGLPLPWATSELPELISDLLHAVGGDSRTQLGPDELARAGRFAELRAGGVSASRLTRELAALHSTLLVTLRSELPDLDPALFGELAARLAAAFGELSGAAVEALLANAETRVDPLTGLLGPKQVRDRLEQLIALNKRYGAPFALVVLAVEDPLAGEPVQPDREASLRVVAGALRRSIRTADEAFRLDSDELGVLAPSQTAEQAEQMAHRVSRTLTHLEEVDGLRITISAGVVACPEHGDEVERLLRAADTAMWRARATGHPVAVGPMQDP